IMKFLFWRCLWLALLLNLASYLWYVAVNLTSMSKVSAIYNTSCFFAYLFSILLLNDRIMVSKIVAVFISIAGVMIMILVNRPGETVDGGERQREFIGDVVSLLCASLIGLYQVVYKRFGTLSDYHSLLFVDAMLAIIGVCTLVICWLPLPFLSWIEFEVFEIPAWPIFRLLLLNAFFGVLYNGAILVVLVLTSPLFASVGIMLTIPVIAVIDMIINGQVLAWNVALGGVGILVGFAILTYVQ
ncbi:hypothetical protein BJ085DRAFT_6928, partial [Dimargaris cristalligena]